MSAPAPSAAAPTARHDRSRIPSPEDSVTVPQRPGPTALTSLLAPGTNSAAVSGEPAPDALFVDLNLDQLVRSLTEKREEYDLAELYRIVPPELGTVVYRQEVGRDLGDPTVRTVALEFAQRFRDVRSDLRRAEQRAHPLQRARWVLTALSRYGTAVEALADGLSGVPIRSHAFVSVRDELARYRGSPRFRSLRVATGELEREFAAIRYVVRIRGRRVDVAPYRGEPDYGAEIDATFARFERSAEKEYRFSFPHGPDVNTVESRILDLVAARFPEPFGRLAAIARDAPRLLEPALSRFDRELQFYLAYLELADRLATGSLACSYPEISADGREVAVEGAFDPVLALRATVPTAPIVPNDFSLRPPEQVLVVTGPNQGGKTTFARAFGQVFYLARLGLPVPARSARLPFTDRVLSHFGTAEGMGDGRGRLKDDLLRVHDLLDRSTERTVVVLNESFGSTSVEDAVLLGRSVLRRLVDRGALAVCVTFLDELSRLGPETASMVAGVAPDDPTRRTFRVERRAADGRAFAIALAERHGLAYAALRRRWSP